MKFYYGDVDSFDAAWKAFERNESINIVVEGWRRRFLRKSIPMFLEYFIERERRSEKLKRSEIFRFAPYAFFSLPLWALIRSATSEGMALEYSETPDKLIIMLKASETEKQDDENSPSN